MIYQPADLRPKTLKTAVSGFFLLISVAYLERYLIIEYRSPYSLYGPPYKNCKKLDFSPYKSSINRFHTQKTKNSKPY